MRRLRPRLSRRLLSGQRQVPRVSLVVTGRAGEPERLIEAVRALRAEPGAEIVVAPWGDSGPALPPLEGAVVLPPSSSGNSARNAGVEAATADHLLFLDPTVRLREGELEVLITAAPGGRVVRAVGDRGVLDPASYLFPRVLLAAGDEPGGTVMRFVDEHGDFPEATVARALSLTPVRVAAQPWDRVPGPVVAWPEALDAWLEMVPEVRRLVSGSDRSAWLRELVTGGLADLLRGVESLPYDRLPALADTVGAVLSSLSPNDLARVPVVARATAWLAAQAHWTALAQVVAATAEHDGRFATEVVDGRIRAELPGADWSALRVPSEMLVVGLEESRLTSSVRRVRWVTDSALSGESGSPVLAVDVFAFVQRLGLPHPRIQARWVREGQSDDEPVAALVRARPDPRALVVSDEPFVDQSEGSVTVLTPLDTLPAGRWRLELAVTQDGVVRTGRPSERDRGGSVGAPQPAPDGSAAVLWLNGLVVERAEPGTFKASSPSPPAVLRVRREDDWLAIDLSASGVAEPVRLVGPEQEEAGHVDGESVRFRLTGRWFGNHARALRSGSYRLLAGDRPVPWSPGLHAELGFDVVTVAHRLTARRTPDDAVALTLAAPLADDELGAFAQSLLLHSYDVDLPMVEQVLLESGDARCCDGGPLAVDRVLADRAAELPRIWVVQDHAVQPPEGSTTVLKWSRAWHEALATSRYVVVDDELPSFFDRREGQQVLQTLDGASSDLSDGSLTHRFVRSAQAWSLALAWSEDLRAPARDALGYDGELIAIGRPRADLVVAGDEATRRQLAREGLGLGADDRALLLAPAASGMLLDPTELCAALGAEWTVLLLDPAPGRAAPDVGGRARGARMVQVTGHPRVADLMLASDAGIVEPLYLRVDYALTGRPLLPGPGIDPGSVSPMPDLADLARSLQDLAARVAAQQAEVAAFNARWSPLADGRAATRAMERLLGETYRPDSSDHEPPDAPGEAASGSLRSGR